MVNPIFRNINKLFVQTFNVNGNNHDDCPERNIFNNYDMSLVEMKDFKVLIDRKPMLEKPIKNKQEA